MKRIKMSATQNAICMLLLAAIIPQSAAAGSYLKEAELSEAGDKIHVSAHSPRPLEQVLDALYHKYKWSIEYEDAQYISKLDVVQVETPVKALVPAGATFTVEFPAKEIDEEKVLQLVVDAYNASPNPGRFEVRNLGDDNFAVVGVQAHNLRGAISHQHALLDTPIVLTRQKRTLAATLSLICKKAAAREHLNVVMGVSPRTMVNSTYVEVGGTAPVPARRLIAQALAFTHRRLYWRLLFDPESKGYAFDVHLIPG